MTWVCPDCSKSFAKENQHHKCEVIELEEVFLNKDPSIREIYKELYRAICDELDVSETTSSKAITLYTTTSRSFLIVQPKRKWIDIWFPLDHRMEDFPVFKIVQLSKHRFAHYVRLESESDISQEVLAWVRNAYELVSAK